MNSKRYLISARHAGPDPASRSKTITKTWIPGQARNDETAVCVV